MIKRVFHFVLPLLILSGGVRDSLAAEKTSESGQKVEFTYQGSENDDLYRTLASALTEFQMNAQIPENASCQYEPIQGKMAKKLRKKYDLPDDLELNISICRFTGHLICETSWWKNRKKCYSGDAYTYPDIFEMSEDGNIVEATALLVFFNKKGQEGGRVTNIFTYKYFGSKGETGWAFDRMVFKKMVDL